MILSTFPTYSSYKESGIEWLGKIPSSWQVEPGRQCLYENKDKNTGMKESTVLSLSYGNIIVKADEKLTGLVPESFETYQIVQPGDIIIRGTDLQNDTTSLRTGLAKDLGIITSAYINLRPKAGVDAAFLHYLLHSYDTQKVFYALGSGLRQNLSYEDFKYLLMPIPALKDQCAIVEFLDAKCAGIHEAVRIKEEQIALLQERRQILIQQAVTRGLTPDAPMKDSGIDWIGEIPAHWEVKRLRHLAKKIGSGVTPTGGALVYTDDGIPLLRSQNILFDKINVATAARISMQVHKRMSNSQVRKGDVLLNITGGSIGRCHYVDIDDALNVNQHVCIIRPTHNIQPHFLSIMLASTIGQEQIWHWQQGGGREGLNFASLKEFIIPTPPIEEQNSITQWIDEHSTNILNAISSKQKQITALKEYKSSLINAAVTGKIKVI